MTEAYITEYIIKYNTACMSLFISAKNGFSTIIEAHFGAKLEPIYSAKNIIFIIIGAHS